MAPVQVQAHGRCQLFIDISNFLNLDLACAKGSPVVAAVCTSTNAFPLVAPSRHWASDQRQNGLVGRYASHDLCGNGLVASWSGHEHQKSIHITSKPYLLS